MPSRGYVTNGSLADLVRRIRRTYTSDELKRIFSSREDDDLFIRIGMTAKRIEGDIGRLPQKQRNALAFLGYEIATNSPKAAEYMTMQY